MVRCCGCGDVYLVDEPHIKEVLEVYGVNSWICLDCKGKDTEKEVKDGRRKDK